MEQSTNPSSVRNTGQLVTVDELVDLVALVAGKRVHKRHDLAKPQGVRGRNSDNTRLGHILGWTPSVTLEDGIRQTYCWIEGELYKQGRLPNMQPVK